MIAAALMVMLVMALIASMSTNALTELIIVTNMPTVRIISAVLLALVLSDSLEMELFAKTWTSVKAKMTAMRIHFAATL